VYVGEGAEGRPINIGARKIERADGRHLLSPVIYGHAKCYEKHYKRTKERCEKSIRAYGLFCVRKLKSPETQSRGSGVDRGI